MTKNLTVKISSKIYGTKLAVIVAYIVALISGSEEKARRAGMACCFMRFSVDDKPHSWKWMGRA